MNAKKKVLIVDDDEMILNSLEAIVKIAGFEVHTASSGAAAIAKIDAGHPDVVILDLIMPSPGGAEVLKHMQTGTAIGIPVVVITAAGADHPAVHMAKEAPNVHEFLNKPIRKDTLVDALKKILKL